MNKPFVKFITDFGPLLIFFTVYFKNGNDLKLALPPFIVATLISLIIIYFLERKIPIIPLSSGILITFFGGLTLYFDNPVFYYVKPTIINSFDTYKNITEQQEELYRKQSIAEDCDRGLELLKAPDDE